MILAIRKSTEVRAQRAWAERILLVLAGIALLASLFFPIWRITLEAPQYPEGMGMQIWSSTIKGENPHDLDIINELNHYIGMKKIIPESIPELDLIAPLTMAFAAACLLAALMPGPWTSGGLLFALSGLGAYGMYDFWTWEYDYGHDLNPMAAIKVPGMSYQPPLIGEAKLLNFLSTSWPAMGGYLLFLGGGLIAFALVLGLLRKTGWRGPRGITVLPAFCLLFAGCGQAGPAPIHWGEDACHHCKMVLVQKGFASQRINGKGKVFLFDSIECMLEDLKAKPMDPEERVFVSDWSRPDAAVLDAEAVTYLKGGQIPSPMGGALAAFQTKDSAAAYQGRVGGTLLEWNGLRHL